MQSWRTRTSATAHRTRARSASDGARAVECAERPGSPAESPRRRPHGVSSVDSAARNRREHPTSAAIQPTARPGRPSDGRNTVLATPPNTVTAPAREAVAPGSGTAPGRRWRTPARTAWPPCTRRGRPTPRYSIATPGRHRPQQRAAPRRSIRRLHHGGPCPRSIQRADRAGDRSADTSRASENAPVTTHGGHAELVRHRQDQHGEGVVQHAPVDALANPERDEGTARHAGRDRSRAAARPAVTVGAGVESAADRTPRRARLGAAAAAGIRRSAAPSSEQTPVSGSTSSTRRAASQSPAIALTTDRACS